jgi:hypothetical protein
MPFKDQFKVVAVSVLFSLMFAFGLFKLVSPKIGLHTTLGPADDAPIVMAGGSLFIGTYEGFAFQPDSTLPAQLDYSANMQVFGVDIGYLDSSTGKLNIDHTDVSSGSAGAVTLSYCKNANCSGVQNVDTINLNWSPSNPISITSSLNLLSQGSRLLPNLIVHPRKKWLLRHVNVTGGTTTLDRDCGTESECNVIVHNCTGGSGVTCVPAS